MNISRFLNSVNASRNRVSGARLQFLMARAAQDQRDQAEERTFDRRQSLFRAQRGAGESDDLRAQIEAALSNPMLSEQDVAGFQAILDNAPEDEWGVRDYSAAAPHLARMRRALTAGQARQAQADELTGQGMTNMQSLEGLLPLVNTPEGRIEILRRRNAILQELENAGLTTGMIPLPEDLDFTDPEWENAREKERLEIQKMMQELENGGSGSGSGSGRSALERRIRARIGNTSTPGTTTYEINRLTRNNERGDAGNEALSFYEGEQSRLLDLLDQVLADQDIGELTFNEYSGRPWDSDEPSPPRPQGGVLGIGRQPVSVDQAAQYVVDLVNWWADIPESEVREKLRALDLTNEQIDRAIERTQTLAGNQ